MFNIWFWLMIVSRVYRDVGGSWDVFSSFVIVISDWNERSKHIAKLWRKVPTEQRAPYLVNIHLINTMGDLHGDLSKFWGPDWVNSMNMHCVPMWCGMHALSSVIWLCGPGMSVNRTGRSPIVGLNESTVTDKFVLLPLLVTWPCLGHMILLVFNTTYL